jgi:MFS family permease
VTTYVTNMYIGTFDIQLADARILSPHDERWYARLLTIFMSLGVVAVPAVGVMMDFWGFPATSVVIISTGIIWAVMLLLNTPMGILISFVCYTIYRTFFYTFFFSYVADLFGFTYFGILAGILFVFGGFIGLTQYWLVKLVAGDCHLKSRDDLNCDHGRWQELNAIFLIFVISTAFFSFHDWKERKRRAEVSEQRRDPHIRISELMMLTKSISEGKKSLSYDSTSIS